MNGRWGPRRLLVDLLAAAIALFVFLGGRRRSQARRAEDPHPYRAPVGLPEDRRGDDRVLIAVVIALAGAAPLATVLLCG